MLLDLIYLQEFIKPFFLSGVNIIISFLMMCKLVLPLYLYYKIYKCV